MTPIFSLHVTVWACVLVAMLGFSLVGWAVAPRKVWTQNLHFAALLSVSLLGLLTFWSAFLRFPTAIVASLLVLGGTQVHDFGYWLSLLLGLLADSVVTIWCLYEAITHAWDLSSA
jgi:CBS-domain-containing membrane protein